MNTTLFLQLVLHFASGGFLVVLAITVLRDNPANRLNRIAGAMLFFAGLGPVVMGTGAIVAASAVQLAENRLIDTLSHIWELFFPLLVIFSWVFPLDRLKDFKYPRLRHLLFVPAFAHVVLLGLYTPISDVLLSVKNSASESGFSSIVLTPLAKLASWLLLLMGLTHTYQDVIFGSVNVIFALAGIYFFESGRAYVTNPRLLTQTQTVMWGLRVSLGVFILATIGRLISPTTFTGALYSSLLSIATLAGAVVFASATIRHQFLDLRSFFRQSFIVTLTSAALVGITVLLVIKSETILQPLFGDSADIISYTFIAIILLLFQPVNSWLDSIVRAMFIQTRTDHRNVIERFSRQVISLFQPAKLRHTIEEALQTTLLVERVYFVLYDDTVDEYALVPSDDHPRRIVLDRNDLMLRGINLLDKPTLLSSLTDFREGAHLATLLDERQVRLVLPLKDSTHLLGFIGLTDKISGYRYSSDDLHLLGVLSNQMVTALTNARLYNDSLEKLRLQEEVTMARQIQLDLLPSSPPAYDHVAISVHSTPSRTVGGDFYDFIKIDEHRFGIVIADASGKGMPAALLIAQIQAIIRSEVSNGNPIGAMLHNMNRQVHLSSSSEKFVTLFYGELDTRTGTLRYSNAGHNYPVLARSDGSVELLITGGPLIGAFPSLRYQEASTTLGTDDMLFLFTDGLCEAMNEQEQEYGEARLQTFVKDSRGCDPGVLIENILSDVRSFDPADPPRDDTTIVAMKITEKK